MNKLYLLAFFVIKSELAFKIVVAVALPYHFGMFTLFSDYPAKFKFVSFGLSIEYFYKRRQMTEYSLSTSKCILYITVCTLYTTLLSQIWISFIANNFNYFITNVTKRS